MDDVKAYFLNQLTATRSARVAQLQEEIRQINEDYDAIAVPLRSMIEQEQRGRWPTKRPRKQATPKTSEWKKLTREEMLEYIDQQLAWSGHVYLPFPRKGAKSA